VQMMHSYSADVAAAVTITFNYDMIAFIPMLGLGFAITSLVGQRMGADNPEGALKISRLAMKVGALYGLTMVLLFVFLADPLVRVFTGGFSGGDESVVSLAKSMLRLASIYIMADVVQLVFAGTLRGAGDTRWVMYISVAMHWVLALMAWLMIKVFVIHPLAVWLGFISFVVLLGFAMFIRYKLGPWKEMRIIK